MRAWGRSPCTVMQSDRFTAIHKWSWTGCCGYCYFCKRACAVLILYSREQWSSPFTFYSQSLISFLTVCVALMLCPSKIQFAFENENGIELKMWLQDGVLVDYEICVVCSDLKNPKTDSDIISDLYVHDIIRVWLLTLVKCNTPTHTNQTCNSCWTFCSCTHTELQKKKRDFEWNFFFPTMRQGSNVHCGLESEDLNQVSTEKFHSKTWRVHSRGDEPSSGSSGWCQSYWLDARFDNYGCHESSRRRLCVFGMAACTVSLLWTMASSWAQHSKPWRVQHFIEIVRHSWLFQFLKQKVSQIYIQSCSKLLNVLYSQDVFFREWTRTCRLGRQNCK